MIILDDCSADETPRMVEKTLLEVGAHIAMEYLSDDGQQSRRIKIYELPSGVKVLYVRNERNVGKTINLNWAAFSLVESGVFSEC